MEKIGKLIELDDEGTASDVTVLQDDVSTQSTSMSLSKPIQIRTLTTYTGNRQGP